MLKDKLVRWFSRTCFDRGTNNVTETSVTLTTDIGFARNENQDRVAVMRLTTKTAKPFVVVALVDGMGGMFNGTECAIHALSAFLDGLSRFREEIPKERLTLAANAANMAIYKLSSGRGGTTLSALLVTPDHDPLILNIGDSRIYSTVDEDKKAKVERLTIDDSLEEAVGGHGKELLQFIGMGDGLIPHIKVVPEKTKRILITSDGIHFINRELLREALVYAPNLEKISEILCTFAKFRGAPDNASLAVCDLQELIQSLSKSNESGVELWDPFSALLILWQEEAPPASTPSPASSKDPIKKHVTRPKKSHAKNNSPKNTKKKTEAKAIPELILDINPEANKGEDK